MGNKISTEQYPVILNINILYKKIIEEYLKNETKYGFINDYVFQILLKNAEIYYFDGTYKEIS